MVFAIFYSGLDEISVFGNLFYTGLDEMSGFGMKYIQRETCKTFAWEETYLLGKALPGWDWGCT